MSRSLVVAHGARAVASLSIVALLAVGCEVEAALPAADGPEGGLERIVGTPTTTTAAEEANVVILPTDLGEAPIAAAPASAVPPATTTVAPTPSTPSTRAAAPTTTAAPPTTARVTTTAPPTTTAAPTTTTTAPPTTTTTTAPPPTTTARPAATTASVGPGCWAAPSGWESYEKVNVPVAGGDIRLDAGRDYQLIFPDRPVEGVVKIHGGRNVVVMGGEISIDTFSYSKGKRMGMKVFGSTGIVHLEGLEIGGEWLTEGIQFAAPQAQAVVQNMRIGPISGGQNAPMNHADLIQTWGGLGRGESWALRICGLSGWSNMNGFFLVDDAGGEIGPVDIRYVNIDLVDAPNVNHSEETGGFNAFFMNRVVSVHFEPGTVWADANDYRHDGTLSQSLVPRGTGDRVDGSGNVYVEFDRSHITGRIYHGVVPDYVPAGSVGIGYTPG